MADFDIHRLDGLDPASSRAEGELQRYQDALREPPTPLVVVASSASAVPIRPRGGGPLR